MRVRRILLNTIATIILLMPVVHASAGSPVTHVHDGRSHSHPLPATGKNHSHNKKPAVPQKAKPKSSEEWVQISGTFNKATGTSFVAKVKIGSFKKTGGRITALLNYVEKKATGTTSSLLAIESISIADCIAEYGKIRTRSLSTDQVSHSSFAFGAGSVNSQIAEALCSARKYNLPS